MIVYIPTKTADRDALLKNLFGWDVIIFVDSYPDPRPKWKRCRRQQVPVITVYVREVRFLRFWWNLLEKFDRIITQGQYLGRNCLTIEGLKPLAFMKKLDQIPGITVQSEGTFFLP